MSVHRNSSEGIGSGATLGQSHAQRPLPAWYRPDIQGLRGVAILGVVMFHAGLPIAGGFLGVDVFFVISGFVILGLLLRLNNSHGRIPIWDFFVRRFVRLAPASLLMITITLMISFILLSPFGAQQMTAATGITATFSASNFVLAKISTDYFSPSVLDNPLLHTWSLSVEEQFYIFFAFLVILTIGTNAKRLGNRLAIVLSVFAIASLTMYLIGEFNLVAGGFDSLWMGFYSPLSRAWEFLAGALIVCYVGTKGNLPNWLKRLAQLLGLALILLAFLFGDEFGVSSVGWRLAAVVGSALIIWGGTGPDVRVIGLLRSHVLGTIGDVSYSWYLWHWPMIVFAIALAPAVAWAPLAAVTLALGIAYPSRKFVEMRFANPERKTKPRVGIVVTSLIVPLTLGAALLWVSTSAWPMFDFSDQIKQVRARHAAAANGCEGESTFILAKSTNCWWNAGASGPPVYLIGDSNADQFSEALIEASSITNHPLFIASNPDCPLLLHQPRRVSDVSNGCERFTRTFLEWLINQRRGLVIIAMSDHYWTLGEFRDSPSPRVLAESETGLRDVLATLKSHGFSLAIVQSIPQYRSGRIARAQTIWAGTECSIINLALDSCAQKMDRTIALSNQMQWRNVVTRVAKTFGAHVVDLWDDLCDGQQCSMGKDGNWAYRDGKHISVAESSLLANRFATVIAK